MILGARSLDDMINRLDSAKSVTSLDARCSARSSSSAPRWSGTASCSPRRSTTPAARGRAARRREAARSSRRSREQNSLLASIKGEIARARRGRARAPAADAPRQRRRGSPAARGAQRAGIRHGRRRVGDHAVRATRSIAPPSTHGGVVGVAMSQLGTPYVWGGAARAASTAPASSMWAYAQVGVSLPHSSYAQYGYGVPVSRDQLQPGDLVFFDGLGHVGIYIGGGQFVHAPHTGDVVKISSLDEAGTRRRTSALAGSSSDRLPPTGGTGRCVPSVVERLTSRRSDRGSPCAAASASASSRPPRA